MLAKFARLCMPIERRYGHIERVSSFKAEGLMKDLEEDFRIARVKGQTLRELAFGEIRRAMLAGRFFAGEAITIRELAEELGLGVMPVREGVHQLASQGALEFLPNRSVRVPFHTIAELEKVFEARILLESYATEAAAELMSRSDIKNISSVTDKIFDMSRPVRERLHANYDFHFTIYNACGSPYILEMIERLWLRIGPLHFGAFRSSQWDQEEFLSVRPLHGQLVEALSRRQGAAAGEILTVLLNKSLDWYRRHTDSLRPEPRIVAHKRHRKARLEGKSTS